MDAKDNQDRWIEGQIVEKRQYSKSAGHFLDDPFSDSDDEGITDKNEYLV